MRRVNVLSVDIKSQRDTLMNEEPSQYHWYMARSDFLPGTTWFTRSLRTDVLYDASYFVPRMCEVVGIISTKDHFMTIRGNFDPVKTGNFAMTRNQFLLQHPRIEGIPELDRDFDTALQNLDILFNVSPVPCVYPGRYRNRVVQIEQDGSIVLRFSHHIFKAINVSVTSNI